MMPSQRGAPLAAQALQQAQAVGQEALLNQARALGQLAQSPPPGFAAVLKSLWACTGQVVFTGVGKSGHVGRKAAATFASIGARATFMHATEAAHGDLGLVGPHDVVLALSFSGASQEILALVSPLRASDTKLLALTGAAQGPLAQQAETACVLGPITEACPLGLVPTTSTTAMLAVTDAWAMALQHLLGPSAENYGARHPAGALGLAVRPVFEVMRTGQSNPVAHTSDSLRHVLAIMTGTRGRPGAAAIVDDNGRLVGLFTDGDLRRLTLRGSVDVQAPIHTLMHAAPKTVGPKDLVATALALLQHHGIDQVPVVDGAQKPVGFLDVHDVLP